MTSADAPTERQALLNAYANAHLTLDAHLAATRNLPEKAVFDAITDARIALLTFDRLHDRSRD